MVKKRLFGSEVKNRLSFTCVVVSTITYVRYTVIFTCNVYDTVDMILVPGTCTGTSTVKYIPVWYRYRLPL